MTPERLEEIKGLFLITNSLPTTWWNELCAYIQELETENAALKKQVIDTAGEVAQKVTHHRIIELEEALRPFGKNAEDCSRSRGYGGFCADCEAYSDCYLRKAAEVMGKEE